MSDAADSATPYLAVDRDTLDRNIARGAQLAAALGVRMRPHVKTHKCLEIARRQRDAGATGITVATVGEAEVFVRAGFDDVFVAYPLWVDGARGRRLRALAERARISVGVDSASGAAALARAAGSAVRVLVEVDSGHHRSGVEPRAAGTVAAAAARAGLTVAGVFTFPGHGYAPGAAGPAAAQEAAALTLAAQAVRDAGVQAPVRSGGSTPTLALSDATAVTELRPGVYALGDAQQLELGRCAHADLALRAVSTVVSRRPGAVVLDAGSKVLGADRPGWASGWGRLPDRPGARVVALSEHHATVRLEPGDPGPALGERVGVVPNHACAAVNLADELVVEVAGRPVEVWRVAARGANT